MKNADAWVFGILGIALVGYVGWETRGFYESNKVKQPILTRVEISKPVHLLDCPVTPETIMEYKRTCAANERNRIISDRVLKK